MRNADDAKRQGHSQTGQQAMLRSGSIAISSSSVCSSTQAVMIHLVKCRIPEWKEVVVRLLGRRQRVMWVSTVNPYSLGWGGVCSGLESLRSHGRLRRRGTKYKTHASSSLPVVAFQRPTSFQEAYLEEGSGSQKNSTSAQACENCQAFLPHPLTDKPCNVPRPCHRHRSRAHPFPAAYSPRVLSAVMTPGASSRPKVITAHCLCGE